MWVEVLDVVEVPAVIKVTGLSVVVGGVVNIGVELVDEANWHCSEILIKILAYVTLFVSAQLKQLENAASPAVWIT